MLRSSCHLNVAILRYDSISQNLAINIPTQYTPNNLITYRIFKIVGYRVIFCNRRPYACVYDKIL